MNNEFEGVWKEDVDGLTVLKLISNIIWKFELVSSGLGVSSCEHDNEHSSSIKVE